MKKKSHSTVPPPTSAPMLMPQAPELEEVILGALIIEKTAYDRVGDLLAPQHFYVKKNQLVFEAIQALGSESHPIDMLTVTERLKKMGYITDIGGPYYISELTLKVASSAHIQSHALILIQKALARELIVCGAEIQAAAFDPSIDVHESLQMAEEKIFRIAQNSSQDSMECISNILTRTKRHISAACAMEDSIPGLRSGFHGIDNTTAGWQKSELVIIAARPAMGKTAFMLTMAKNMAIENKTKIAIFSLEMSSQELCTRLIANVAEIHSERLNRGLLTLEEWHEMELRLNVLYENNIFIDDAGALSIYALKSKARRLKRQHGIQCIMIDYLQLMNASGSQFNNREQEVSLISRSLKALAKELDIPIIALSQLNRGVENRYGENKRPNLADLRESGAIEQDADIVCFLHRPEYYKIYEDENGQSTEGMAEFIIAKHRRGPTKDIRLRFHKELVRFEN